MVNISCWYMLGYINLKDNCKFLVRICEILNGIKGGLKSKCRTKNLAEYIDMK